MKAIRVHQRGEADAMILEEIERPRPAAGQVLLKVEVAGVNYADILQRNGQYHYLQPLPVIPGFEAAGVVEAVGVDVTTLQPGMRVFSLVMGGYAEYALAEAKDVLLLPGEVSPAQAVVIPVQGQTAYLTLTRAARLQKGERVLIHTAAGGVGSLQVQLARLLGAGMVIGTTTSLEKVDFIRSLGADAVVLTNEPDWTKQVMQLTNGQGVDVVLDAIGGEVRLQTLHCMALFGRLVIFGTLTGDPTFLPSQMLVPNCVSLNGYNTNVQPLSAQRHASEELLRLIASGKLHVMLDDSFPLANAVEAHKAIEARKTHGKVTLTV